MNRRESVLALAALAAPLTAIGGRAGENLDPQDETWRDEARGRDLPVRVRWPGGDGPCGFVIFSHGLGGNRAGGNLWGEAWQAAGLAVLHIQHPGSDTEALRSGLRGLRQAAGVEQYIRRIADAHFVLDELQRRQATAGPWRRVRLDAIGFCGHSFGARLTQALAGEKPPRAPRSALEQMIDPRPRAFIAFSPGFNERDGTDDASLRERFGAITRPFLCLTGTHDDSMIVGDANNATRRAVVRGLPPGRRAGLVLAGADHMTFAGQDGRSRSALQNRLLRRAAGAAELEPRHHRVVAALTNDWWRWALLDDAAARERLSRPEGLTPDDSWQIG